ncbi:MAG: YceD family protein [Brevefilum sp.]
MYNKAIGSSHDVPVDIDQIEIDDLTIRSLKSMVRLSRTREGLLMQARAEGEVLTSCVRCLQEIYLPVETEFEELYQFPSRHREETDLILPHDGYLDLSLIYREYLILAIPIKQLCETSCLGLCPVCGANLNETTCEHHPEEGVQAGSIDQ